MYARSKTSLERLRARAQTEWLKLSKNSMIHRTRRLAKAEAILKEEYEKLPSQLKAYKIELQRQETLPLDQRRYPRARAS
jgi:transposase